jgi:hypothetical protein
VTDQPTRVLNDTVDGRGLGWVQDYPSHRDYKLRNFGVTRMTARDYGPIDLRARGIPVGVGDQGNLGSCVPFSTVDHVRGVLHLSGQPDFVGSVLFAYYNTRVRMGTRDWDSGCYPRVCYDSLRHEGNAPDEHHPYVPSQFRSRPSDYLYTRAMDRQLLAYFWIDADDTTSLLRCLHDEYEFTVAMPLFESWRRIGSDGMVPMPGPTERLLGGHQMRCVGRIRVGRRLYWVVRNQWGTDWGDGGDCYVPDEYRRAFWRDCRTIRAVESPPDPIAMAA